MPQSPTTPTRRRRSSGFSSPSQYRTHSRVSSIQSIRSNNTQRRTSAHGLDGEPGNGEIMAQARAEENALSSLADELAEEEWDDDEYTDPAGDSVAEGYSEATPPGTSKDHSAETGTLSPVTALHGTPNGSKALRSRHKSKPSDYDGSDWGDSDDFEEVQGIPPSLESMMLAIENLARQGTGESAGQKNVIVRVADQLADLRSQLNVETHITRLSTAHTALTTNLANQSRILASLSHPLSSPLGAPPESELVDELIPLIETLFLSLPHPPASPLPSIQALHGNTDEVLSLLSYLSDSLHMVRQTTNLATRKLKEARENTALFRRELDEAEEAGRWLDKGNWDRRLQQREAAIVCRDVVGGFEEVCEDWRQRLIQSESNGVELVAG